MVFNGYPNIDVNIIIITKTIVTGRKPVYVG